MSEELNRTIDLAVGALFIMFHAAGRFNTPATNRSSTSAGRYYMSLSCYCLVGLFLYGVLVMFPQLVTFVTQGDSAAMEPWAQKFSNPLMVALLTLALPKLPLLAEVDNWVRRQLQDMAAIPYEVRRLVAELRKSKLETTTEVKTTVRQRLTNTGFNAKDINFEPSWRPTYLWTRLVVLFENLGNWESDKKMSRYLAAVPGEMVQLRKRYEQLIPKAKTCFRLLNEAATVPDGGTSRTYEALVRYQEDFMEQLNELHNSLLEFISRGVLHSLLTDHSRIERLRALGFQIELPSLRLTFNHLMMLFGLVFGVMLTGMVFFSSNQTDTFGRMLTRLVMVAVIYSVAIVCAVFPKGRGKFARGQAGENRQVGFYLLSGLSAVVISQLISLLFNVVTLHNIQHGFLRSLLSYPWLLSTFATTVMTAILIDNPRFPKVPGWAQRLVEGLIQGIVMVGVAYLVHSWLAERVLQVKAMSELPFAYRVPDAGQMMTMAGMIGFVVGFCIPTWYREAPRSRPEIQEAPCAMLPQPTTTPTPVSVG